MKLTRYIRPTSHSSVPRQLGTTERDGISIDIIEGEAGRTFDNALKQLKPGDGLLIEGFYVLGRKRADVCKRIKAVFAKGANIVTFRGDRPYTPQDEAPLIEMLMTQGLTVEGRKAGPRKAHNKTDPEKLKEAKRYWTQKQFSAMTNKDIAEAVGVSVVTLTKELGPRGIRKPGRLKAR